MSCTLGRVECQLEFPIMLPQMHQALKLAAQYSINTPVEKRIIKVGTAGHPVPVYPYVWNPIPDQNTIRLEMGKDRDGKRIVAAFSMKQALSTPGHPVGVAVHVAVFLITGKEIEPVTMNPEWTAVYSVDARYHFTAAKMFRGALLRMPLGSDGYVIAVPEEPPPPPPEDEPLPPPPTT